MANEYKWSVDENGKLDRMAQEILLTQPQAAGSANPLLRDDQWARQAFIVGTPQKEKEEGFLDDIDIKNRYFSSAYLKWTDSSLGGNVCINPLPQFTRYADIREPGLRAGAVNATLHSTQGDLGMGNYYSEAIDDNMQLIHMRFGVPSYNSLTQFFTGFYNSSASLLARTGRLDDTIIDGILKVGATLISIAVLPLMIVPIAVGLIGHAARFFLKWPASKFYYSKPSMATYWLAVSNMVNQLAGNRGMNHSIPAYQQENILGITNTQEKREGGVLHTLFPDIIKENGTIDVHAISNRSKILQNRQDYNLMRAIERAGEGDWYEQIKILVNEQRSGINTEAPNEVPEKSLESYLERFLNTGTLSRTGTRGKDSEKQFETDLKASDADENTDLEGTPFAPGKASTGISNYILGTLSDGSDWVTFRVNHTGPVTDTFSSSTAKSSLADKINMVSKTARDVRINFAQGNIGADPLGIVNAVGSGIGMLMTGASNLLQISGIAALAGSAFVDIPDHWAESTASLAKTSYSFTLVSPYGNMVSQALYLYTPLCCILAGALPLATGKQSHTSPFICELYDRGRRTTRLGIITDLTVTRGTSNLSFNNDDHPMSIDVTFSVADLSGVVAMPILPGFSLNIADGLFDPDSMYTDYMMTLSSLHLRDMTDRWPLVEVQWARAKNNFSTYTSASKIGQDIANLPGVNMLQGLMRGTERQ